MLFFFFFFLECGQCGIDFKNVFLHKCTRSTDWLFASLKDKTKMAM